MSAVPVAGVAGSLRWPRHTSVQTYAKVAGVLLLLSLVCGALGEAYIPSRLVVSNDAAATARNVAQHHVLFRWGFVSYLVEAACDVALAIIFYALLRPVSRTLALLAAFFGLLATGLYAVAEAFYFAPLLILSGAEYLQPFSPEQLNALALLSFKFFGRLAGIFMAFYGLGWVLRGYLIFRSGYLPRALGVLLAVAGLGFIVQNIALVLAPGYASNLLAIPMAVAALALMLWLFARGIDVPKWEAAQVDAPPRRA